MIEWIKTHWLEITAAATGLFTFVNITVRWVVPGEKMDQWIATGNKIQKIAATVYIKIEEVLTHSR